MAGQSRSSGQAVEHTHGGTDLRITLHGVGWVSDATIDGSGVWDQSSARLTVHPDGAAPVWLTGRWLALAARSSSG
jgi:hypothetical protein